MSIAGIQPGGGVTFDLLRGGVSCFWPQFSELERKEGDIPCYSDVSHALRIASGLPQASQSKVSDHHVLKEANQLLEGVAAGRSIRATIQEKIISIHRLGAGQRIEINGKL